jgi:hypothetical protein
MGRLKITGKLSCLLAFVNILFFSCGLHLIHPLLHEHNHCHVNSADNRTHTGFGFSLIEESCECPICTFLANFHISCPTPAVLITALDFPFKYPAQVQVGTLQKLSILQPGTRAPPSSILLEYSV